MYPRETVAISKTGKKEARILRAKGSFVIYGYESLEGKGEAKYSLLLAREDGRLEHIMLLPTAGGKELVIKHAFEGMDNRRGIFDEKTKKVVYFP